MFQISLFTVWFVHMKLSNWNTESSASHHYSVVSIFQAYIFICRWWYRVVKCQVYCSSFATYHGSTSVNQASQLCSSQLSWPAAFIIKTIWLFFNRRWASRWFNYCSPLSFCSRLSVFFFFELWGLSRLVLQGMKNINGGTKSWERNIE